MNKVIKKVNPRGAWKDRKLDWAVARWCIPMPEVSPEKLTHDELEKVKGFWFWNHTQGWLPIHFQNNALNLRPVYDLLKTRGLYYRLPPRILLKPIDEQFQAVSDVIGVL